MHVRGILVQLCGIHVQESDPHVHEKRRNLVPGSAMER